MSIQVITPVGRLIDRHLEENLRAVVADLQAVQDYNIMMGTMEDPREEDEEDA